MTYTIKQIKPTGETASSFGTPYWVQFEEDDRAVKVTKKSEPKVGDKLDGEIKESPKYGAYFKSAPRENTNIFAGGKKNGDGQRQGMCLNNAAASLVFKEFTDDTEWATTVYARANALYKLGDLGNDVVATIPGAEDVTPLTPPNIFA